MIKLLESLFRERKVVRDIRGSLRSEGWLVEGILGDSRGFGELVNEFMGKGWKEWLMVIILVIYSSCLISRFSERILVFKV